MRASLRRRLPPKASSIPDRYFRSQPEFRAQKFQLAFLESPPGTAVTGEKFVSLLRAPRTGWIFKKLGLVLLPGPRFFDRIDERPRFFDFVPPGKERGVAAHRIQEQSFVRFRT